MLISGNSNEALTTALQIENENNALINTFGSTKPQKQSLMNAFNDVTDNPNQMTIESQVEEVEEAEEPSNPFNMSDEQIEAELSKVKNQESYSFDEPTYFKSEEIDGSLFSTE